MLPGETKVKQQRGEKAESCERDRGDFRNAGTLIVALIDRHTRRHQQREI